MLRHKYTKKKLRSKYNLKKRTRRQRGGVKNPKKTISAAKRREMERLSTRKQQPTASNMSPKEERDAQAKMAQLLGEKCDATSSVNDDGTIDCPTNRSQAKKKQKKFHPDHNPGCIDYARDMLTQYNQTCYGDDSNPNRKWDKNNKNYRNEQAALDGFYPGEASAAAVSSGSGGESKDIPSSCKKPASKVMCKRYCKAKGVTDPKCDCCPGSDAAKKAIAKENQPLALTDGSVGPSARDLIRPQNTQEIPIVSVQKEEPVQPAVAMLEDRPQEIKVTETSNTDPTPAPIADIQPTPIVSPTPQPIPAKETCFESQIDPTSGNIYYVEKNKDGSYTNVSQWEKPASKDMCKKASKMDSCKTHTECTDPKKPYCNPVQEKCNTLPKGWSMALNEDNKAYFYGTKNDGTYSEPQWTVPTEPFVDNTSSESKSDTPSKVEKKWNADKTIGYCREMDLHPGAEYWINPEDGSISFQPIEGVEKQVVTEETDYYYNSDGETTFDPSDGTCGDISKDGNEEEKKENKQEKPKIDYIKLFFTSHFNKIKQIDDQLSDKKQKVIPWLAKR